MENGFNWNISRYINTADEEEIINLEDVKRELDNIEKDIFHAKEKHNEFLRELGLAELW